MSTAAISSLGQSIPAYNLHGISVSLPTWQDNIDYEEGAPRVIEKIRSAYPRFKIHYLIEQVSSKITPSLPRTQGPIDDCVA